MRLISEETRNNNNNNPATDSKATDPNGNNYGDFNGFAFAGFCAAQQQNNPQTLWGLLLLLLPLLFSNLITAHK